MSSPEVRVVTPPAELDEHTSYEFRNQIGDALDSGARWLVVDLTRVEFINEAGLAALVVALKKVRMHDGFMTLACDQERILKTFRITGWDRLFQILPTVEEAREAV